MTLERHLSALFNLTDENWMRHANPASVWTRYSVLPVLVFSVWSRTWIGWWCLLPGVASILWMLLNPVLFGRPRSTRNWASRAVLGERIYLERDRIALPDHHCTPLYAILKGISALGMVLALWATAACSLWGAVLGVALAYMGKSWFLDRMVWLYEDMRETSEEYRSWEY